MLKIYNTMPEGWDFVPGSRVHTDGTRLIFNGKPLFTKERKAGLLRVEIPQI